MRRVLVRTLGCKLNQYESQFISESFASRGYALSTDESLADVQIVNTCSVTARADSEARQLIRRSLRAAPGALVVVTGCYAQRAPYEVAEMGGVGLVAGNAEKSSLPLLIDQLEAGVGDSIRVGKTRSAAGAFRCGPDFQTRSRALVKIQDGCNGSCSYCVVPSVRGAARSESPERIAEEVRLLEARGFSEVVLTGARVGSYGDDLSEAHCLESLLQMLLSSTVRMRFRLSSLEPAELDGPLLDVFGREPMQSADEQTLLAMHRPYSPADYSDSIRAIKVRRPDACIGADVMVGFPGEGESAFARTYETIESLPLSYLHVFPFSRRPGTAAWSMGQQCSESARKKRAAALRTLGRRKKLEFMDSQVGSIQDVILEKQIAPGIFTATASNFLRVRVRTDRASRGEALRVRTQGRMDGMLGAEPF
jgi:threonylcarbamoyladenosine tRNA methylthiotransferase MtaB